MKKMIVIINFIFFLLSSNLQGQSTQDTKKEYPEVDTIVNAFLKQANLPGLSIAVNRNGKIIYAQGFGYADVISKVKMSPLTQLRTASVAKVITATALGKLLSEEKLNLDAPVKKYIPYINDKYANLTTRQLAGHTSGMQHRPKGTSYKRKQFSTIKETIELMNAPLLFAPDTDYEYSTHAFNILAGVIEGASGKRYTEYLNESIFKPLKMYYTAPENIKQLTDKDAKLYYVKEDKLREDKLTNASYKIPGAGFRSTPIDLAKMMNAYTTGFLSQKAIDELFKSHQLKNGKKTNVGIAWRSSIDIFGHPVIEHAGKWRGARTVIVYYPEEKLSVSLMINADCPVYIEETAHILAQFFRDDDKKLFKKHTYNHKIELTSGKGENRKVFKGKLSLEGLQGSLKVDTDNFLKSNPIYRLKKEHHYTLVTRHGLLFLELSDSSDFNGQLFIYGSRNKINPKHNTPALSFVPIN
ncbi:serine hydrolase [Flavobacteriaceae bacterium R38]|nr:serine hydrolase [Flavobacteriaceae bacterium R38]